MFGINKYLIMIVVVGALVAFTGYTSYHHGKKISDNGWLLATAKTKQTHQKIVKELNEKHSADLSLLNVNVMNIAHNLYEVQNEITDINSANNRSYADIERMFFDISAERANPSEEGTAAIAAAECDGGKKAVLSGVVSQAIYRKFGECDSAVQQLTACQQILTTQREYCNN